VGLFPEKKLTVEVKEAITEENCMASKIMRVYPQVSKIQSLGWTPRYSIEEGFRRTIRSFLC